MENCGVLENERSEPMDQFISVEQIEGMPFINLNAKD